MTSPLLMYSAANLDQVNLFLRTLMRILRFLRTLKRVLRKKRKPWCAPYYCGVLVVVAVLVCLRFLLVGFDPSIGSQITLVC